MESARSDQYSAVIAAGGLGTRRADWSRYIPKEYFPIHGKPGIALLLEEIAELGHVRAVMVHHPYYAEFSTWASRVLNMPDAYDRFAGAVPRGRNWPGVSLDLIPQSGPYSDITSVLNADDHLGRPSDLFVLYSDNLYPCARPTVSLGGLGAGEAAVFARPYTRAEAAHRGVLVCDGEHVVGLVEKPDEPTARELEVRHGQHNLALLEGRSRVGRPFLDFLHSYRQTGEPKLSLAFGTYARTAPVRVLRLNTSVTDLGAPSPEVS